MFPLLISDCAVDVRQSFCDHASFGVFPGVASLSPPLVPQTPPAVWGHHLQEAPGVSNIPPVSELPPLFSWVDDVVEGQQIIARCSESAGKDSDAYPCALNEI